MKSIAIDDSTNNTSNTNCLGFPTMSSSTAPFSHFNYGDEGENGGCSNGFYAHHMPVMPLKSDGSLSIVDAMPFSLDNLCYQQHQQFQVEQNPNNLRTSNDVLLTAQAKQVQVFPSTGRGDDGMKTLILKDYQSRNHGMEQHRLIDCNIGKNNNDNTKKRGVEKIDLQQKQIVHRKSIDTFGQRTSQYRGVTRHRWTGRYEAHLWDNSCKKEGQSRKGRQVYLGGYDMEEKAAKAYDLAALKYWGLSTHINFSLEIYQKELEEMKNMSRQEYVAHLRRKSSGFSRGASMYRGVTRHHQHGRWQARIGRVAGNKDLYLGTFKSAAGTQEEAAEAYDIAAIKFRGTNAVTNFDVTRYDVERIMASNTLLAGELARRSQSAQNAIPETIPSLKNNESNRSEWTVPTFQSCLQLEQKPKNVFDSYRLNSFSLAPESFLGRDDIRSIHHQKELEDRSKIGSAAHLSNASSVVTSLSSSREGSPDKGSVPLVFAMAPSATSKLFSNPATEFPQMPVFAAWTDA